MGRRGRQIRSLLDEPRLRSTDLSEDAQLQVGQMLAVLHEFAKRLRSLPAGLQIPEPLRSELRKKCEGKGRQKETLGQ